MTRDELADTIAETTASLAAKTRAAILDNNPDQQSAGPKRSGTPRRATPTSPTRRAASR